MALKDKIHDLTLEVSRKSNIQRTRNDLKGLKDILDKSVFSLQHLDWEDSLSTVDSDIEVAMKSVLTILVETQSSLGAASIKDLFD